MEKTCERCATRPRWSNHGNARICAECAKRHGGVAKYERRRKLTQERKDRLDYCPAFDPYDARRSDQNRTQRQRYRALRAAGATTEQACTGSKGARVFARVAAHLSQAGAVPGGVPVRDPARCKPRVPAPTDQPLCLD